MTTYAAFQICAESCDYTDAEGDPRHAHHEPDCAWREMLVEAGAIDEDETGVGG